MLRIRAISLLLNPFAASIATSFWRLVSWDSKVSTCFGWLLTNLAETSISRFKSSLPSHKPPWVMTVLISFNTSGAEYAWQYPTAPKLNA